MNNYNRIEDLLNLFNDINEVIDLYNIVSSLYSSLLLRLKPVEDMDKYDFTVDDIMDMMSSCSFGLEDQEIKTISICSDMVTKYIEPIRALANNNPGYIKYSEVITKNGILIIFRSGIKLEVLGDNVSAKTISMNIEDKIFSIILVDESDSPNINIKTQLMCHEITHYVLNEARLDLYCGGTDKDVDLFVEFICDYIGYLCVYNKSWYTNMINDIPMFNESIREDYENFIDAFHKEFDNF